MSSLEDMLTKAAGKALGVDDDKMKVVKVVLPLLIAFLSSGGLQKLLEKMREMGLGEQASSWVGTGENKPISGDQAKQLLGEDQVKEIADKAGVDEDKAANMVAEALPDVVDTLSADGNEPSAGDVDDLLKSLS
ncbi:MAG: YidB family protein [Actinomycetota bacterium]|nr:YidB family protein [Actinomycetota bacterium]